jgi:hypothetical protein
MEGNSFLFDRTVDFSLLQPVIGFALNSKGPLIVQAFVVALEDAAIPEAEIGFDPWAHLFLMLFSKFPL